MDEGTIGGRMNTDTTKNVISEHESLVVLCTYNILFTNDICCGQLVDCFQAMKHTPYYKHAFKRYLNGADKARRTYEKIVNSVIRPDLGEFFAECNDRFTGEVERHVEMLYWQFKQVLDDGGVEHSAELARFETARTLCEYACFQFDTRMNELKEKSQMFKGFTMEYLRLSNVARLINLASSNLMVSKTVNLNTERCKAAFDILVRKLTDIGIIAGAVSGMAARTAPGHTS